MKKTDLLVVGAGAAGLMAAISAGRQAEGRVSIHLLDSRNKIGAKILVSGGTRCNVTNRLVTPGDYFGGRPHFIRHVLEAFTPSQTIQLFSEMGVPLVLEPSGKYFPQTNSGRTVLNALMEEARKVGVILETDAKVIDLQKEDQRYSVKTLAGVTWTARNVIFSTGGLSLPETGSDGTGLKMAEKLGHPLIATVPALTPFTSNDPDWASLSGIALPTKLSLFLEDKKKAETHDSFLFTHFGYSGPAVLDLSRHWTTYPGRRKRVEANFLPSEEEVSLKAKLMQERSGISVKRFLMQKFPLPERLIDVVLYKAGIPPTAAMSRFTTLQREALICNLLHAPLSVTGVVGYKKAEVTAGGVDLKSIHQATMESKICPGLFFCGEILDVDGRIGGFNFQWAWSSGWVAGQSAVKALL